ncbi:MAG TPA: hypothetical protein VJQ78_02025 [Sphingobium sp.]|nr:hypothetical protein [Sphingobium sp.]
MKRRAVPVARDRSEPFSAPIYQGDEDENIRAAKPTPMTQGREHNRGHRAPAEGSGVVEGSGAGAGGRGNPEDFDSDPVSGGTAEEIGQEGQDDE